MKNVALLKSYQLDNKETLEFRWNEQVQFKFGFNYIARNYVDLEFFTDYFQKVITDIANIAGPYKNIVIQCHDKLLHDEKWHLNVIHTDAERLTCITIPILCNDFETVNFYDNDEVGVRGLSPNRKPKQRVTYSTKHPNLVNVSNLHNVRILDDINPRILLQLSYDVTFDDMISRNKDFWEIV